MHFSKKYSDFLYKIQDSGLSVYAVLLDVRMKSGAKLYIFLIIKEIITKI